MSSVICFSIILSSSTLFTAMNNESIPSAAIEIIGE